jgi:hypothetical protein
VGAVVGGIPLPIVGSMIMAFVGTFVGALVGEMYARRGVAPDVRVGLGAVLGRAIGVATKLSLAFVVLLISVAVVIF